MGIFNDALESLGAEYLKHTFIWAQTGGKLDPGAVWGQFLFFLIAFAVAFFFIYKYMHFTPLMLLFHPDIELWEPAAVFLGSPVGKLLLYLMQVLGLPVLLTGTFPYPAGWPTGSGVQDFLVVAAVLVLVIIPAFLLAIIERD